MLRNIGDPLHGVRQTLKQLIVDRTRIEDLFNRGGCVDEECRRRLQVLDSHIRTLRSTTLAAMQERRNFRV